ncbi:hypothetical protein HO173_008861 [Letharia columbiana]|uniref:FAD-binding PCMH-type domain-containing protein n=1 Tax=Letharia columbiana TaxID=112416 RepID=A0A8H6L2C1_9LECA|nr:uncharacterized protein HO173_008861 [Letharia columbiana]KAF6232898.1 hypothetical protein HO173_008861 [Letharia columbiana]
MFHVSLLRWLFASTSLFIQVHTWGCKCAPEDNCWPSTSQWNTFNQSLSGKLIADVPPALPCYPGPAFNAEACAAVDAELTEQTFVAENPIALSYPTGSCPPINATAGSSCTIADRPTDTCPDGNLTSVTHVGSCSIGDQPRYTVNATEIADVTAGINFARQKNIRLVVRNTGHDLLRRSTGYGSLQVWIRYLRTGIKFQETYQQSGACSKSSWKGSAFVIGGGYTWEDVYSEAASRNVIVVGGGTPSVGCLGGWMQGGGHSPATHDFGLGADQVLEAQVVLASGKVVTANPCENSEIFFAIRGGGPSSYGIVVSTVIKAYPTRKVAAQIFGFAPLTANDSSAFMDALAIVHQNYPRLSDSGFSGYGSWSIYSPSPLIGNYSTGFIHTIAVFGKTVAEAEELFASTAAQLQKYNNTSLYMTTRYLSFPTYVAYYDALSGIVTPVGQTAALGSRFLDQKALTGNATALKAMLQTIAGTPEQATSNNIVFVGGGQVFTDASDPYSGVNPAWRQTYVHNIVARGWAPGSSNATIQAVYDDITYNKTQAMKDLAPNTGCYMNEADRFDPDYLQDFYGEHGAKLSEIKRKYDPRSVFYCPTCIGSELFKVKPSGQICL